MWMRHRHRFPGTTSSFCNGKESHLSNEHCPSGTPESAMWTGHALGKKLISPYRRPELTVEEKAILAANRCVSRMGMSKKDFEKVVTNKLISSTSQHVKTVSLEEVKQEVSAALNLVNKSSKLMSTDHAPETRHVSTPDAFIVSTGPLPPPPLASRRKKRGHSSSGPSNILHTLDAPKRPVSSPKVNENVFRVHSPHAYATQRPVKTADRMTSREMNINLKNNTLDVMDTNIWSDRMGSQLSRPLTAEQFVGGGSFTTQQKELNAPQYVERSEQSAENTPPATFPYSTDAHIGAKKMQSLWRYRQKRVMGSTLLIQKIARGYLDRRYFIWKRNRLNAAAAIIQTRARGMLHRRLVKWMRFAPHLQRILRGHFGRNEARWRRKVRGIIRLFSRKFIYSRVAADVAIIRSLQNKSACLIQAHVRGQLGRIRARRLKFLLETKAAVFIQTRYRGLMERFRYRWQRKYRAAQAIQKYTRRYLAAKSYPGIIEVRKNQEADRLQAERTYVLESRNRSKRDLKTWLFSSVEGRRHWKKCLKSAKRTDDPPKTKRARLLRVIDSYTRSDHSIHHESINTLFKDLLFDDVFHTKKTNKCLDGKHPKAYSRPTSPTRPIHKRDLLKWINSDRRKRENSILFCPPRAAGRTVIRAMKKPYLLLRKSFLDVTGTTFRSRVLRSVLLDGEKKTHYSATAEYRLFHKPPFQCQHCDETFVLFRQWKQHETTKECRINTWSDEERGLNIHRKSSRCTYALKRLGVRLNLVAVIRARRKQRGEIKFPEVAPASLRLQENLKGLTYANAGTIEGHLLAVSDIDEFEAFINFSLSFLLHRMGVLSRKISPHRKQECVCISKVRMAAWDLGYDTVFPAKHFKELLSCLRMDVFNENQYAHLKQLLFGDHEAFVAIEDIGRWYVNETVYKNSIVPHSDVDRSLIGLLRRSWRANPRSAEAQKEAVKYEKRLARHVLNEWLSSQLFNNHAAPDQRATLTATNSIVQTATTRKRLVTVLPKPKKISKSIQLAKALILHQSDRPTNALLAQKYPGWISLSRLGFNFNTCITALKINDGNIQRAATWLLNLTDAEVKNISMMDYTPSKHRLSRQSRSGAAKTLASATKKYFKEVHETGTHAQEKVGVESDRRKTLRRCFDFKRIRSRAQNIHLADNSGPSNSSVGHVEELLEDNGTEDANNLEQHDPLRTGAENTSKDMPPDRGDERLSTASSLQYFPVDLTDDEEILRCFYWPLSKLVAPFLHTKLAPWLQNEDEMHKTK